MAWSLLHQDTFNRSDRNLSGDTMSDGVGTWTVEAGTWTIVSNVVNEDASGDGDVIYDSAMSDVGDQAAEFVTSSDGGGPVARAGGFDGTPTYYVAYRDNTTVRIYKNGGASAADYTLLASSSSGVVANGDTLRIEAEGTTIRGLVNGTQVVSVTDSSFATGKAGMHHTSGLGTASYDSFADYVQSAGTTRGTPFGQEGTAFNGGRTMTGILR